LAHSLKGLAGNVGAEGLQHACEVLEEQARERATTLIAITKAREELERLISTIAQLGERKSDSVVEATGKGVTNEVLETLRKQINEYDTAALETLDRHYELLASGRLKLMFKALEKALQAYDFDAAKAVLVEMSVKLKP